MAVQKHQAGFIGDVQNIPPIGTQTQSTMTNNVSANNSNVVTLLWDLCSKGLVGEL
jgi:hypothetical protein